MYTNIRRFEWDVAKARRNAIKHGIGFREATTTFQDIDYLVTEDQPHSRREQRNWLIGESAQGRLLVTVFTIRRGPAIRIISSRLATAQERSKYEESKGLPF